MFSENKKPTYKLTESRNDAHIYIITRNGLNDLDKMSDKSISKNVVAEIFEKPPPQMAAADNSFYLLGTIITVQTFG